MPTLDDLLSQSTFDTRDLSALLSDLEADDEADPEDLEHARKLADELANYAPDFDYGEQVIRDDYFTEYARELADDISAVPHNGEWPTYCIDWEWAARELQHDYTCVTDHNGVTWWVR